VREAVAVYPAQSPRRLRMLRDAARAEHGMARALLGPWSGAVAERADAAARQPPDMGCPLRMGAASLREVCGPRSSRRSVDRLAVVRRGPLQLLDRADDTPPSRGAVDVALGQQLIRTASRALLLSSLRRRKAGSEDS